MNSIHLLLVGAGGCLGSMARYATAVSIDKKLNSVFPYGTFAVNVIGSLILGIILAWLTKRSGGNIDQWRFFLGTGFCGGFTTFSAFAAENLSLLDQKLYSVAGLYILVSIVCGLAAVWAGFALARILF